MASLITTPNVSSAHKWSDPRRLPKRPVGLQRLLFGFTEIGAPAVVILLTLLILQLDEGVRDTAFVVLVVVGLAFALRYFATVWALLLASAPYIQLQSSLFGMTKVSVFRLALIGLTLVFLLFRKPRRFWRVLTRRVAFYGLVLFVLANIFSSIYLGQLDAAFRSVAYSEPIFVFMLTYYLVKQEPANARQILRAVVIGGLGLFALAMVEYTLQRSVLDILNISYTGSENPMTYLREDRFGLGGRISSTFIQPVYAGTAFFIYAILTAFYIRLYKPISHRFLVALMPAFGAFLVLLTGSRGPLVAIVPTVILFSLLIGGRRAGVTVAVIAALLFGFSTSGILSTVGGYLNDSVAFGTQASSNVFSRLDLTTTLLEIFRENPIVGFGPGMIQKLGFEGILEFERIAGLENQYAVILAEGGILAGATYLFFMLGVFGLLFRMWRGNRGEVKYWAVICLILFTYLFTSAAFANFLIGPVLDTIIAIFAIGVARFEGLTSSKDYPSLENVNAYVSDQTGRVFRAGISRI